MTQTLTQVAGARDRVVEATRSVGSTPLAAIAGDAEPRAAAESRFPLRRIGPVTGRCLPVR